LAAVSWSRLLRGAALAMSGRNLSQGDSQLCQLCDMLKIEVQALRAK